MISKNKIQLVVLIDDNPVTNFFNKTAIQNSNIVNKVVSFNDGRNALNYINPYKAIYTLPDYIFLDLHMPAMNGFEFLENFSKLPICNEIAIIILHDSSLSPLEQKKLNDYSFIKSLHKKALTPNLMLEICERETGYPDSLSIIS